MQRRPTRADVADQAGVSKTTVTYVLSERHDIAIPESTRERVRMAARQLGYRPHAAAQALAAGRTHTVTVVFPIRIIAHYAHVIQMFERHTNAHGYHMIASTVGHMNMENVLPDLWSLLSNLTDGVILADMPGVFLPYIAEVLPSYKPIVSMGIFTVPNIDCVEINLTGGAMAAMEHLLAAHPRRLAFFGPGIPDEQNVLETFAPEGALDPRLFAYRHAMEQAGRNMEIIRGNPADRRASMAALRDHIAEQGCPDALFCFNDEMAISAHRTLRELGFRIPEDVLLVGCDGSEEAEYVAPPLSTIVQPIDTMCALAWEYMLNRLENPDMPRQHITVDAGLVIRGSSQREANCKQ
ncbi:MAG TPA: LacI family DNA-binding transcriptional regulator [Chthonomonadaceae bacterium]|nr:LacI family DNA-binding transcriptional regulator [Chthonomonadaceae bacterium]